MLREKRLSQILKLLQRDGQVEISNLCRMFNVTDMTIRRDLDNLSKTNDIVRTHGGAMLVDNATMAEPPIDRRLITNSEAKERIGKKALEYINTGKTLIIDSGTTTMYVALNMSNDMHNIVITNGINIAQETITRPHIRTLLIGGELRRNTLSTRGALAQEQLLRFKADIAFIGTNAIGEDGYCYIGSTSENGFKRAIIATAATTILLADSTKFNLLNLISYAHVSELDYIITDDGITQQTVDTLTDMGAKIIIA